jgi:hypothetical protein
MSFDHAQTPTLQVVATPDEQALSEDLQARVKESISEAEAQPEVAAAAEARRAAEERLHRLEQAERALSRYAKQAREQISTAIESAVEAIVESAASEGEPDFKKLSKLAAAENQSRYASRAIERLVEHLIPLAQIARLREESFALMTKAKAVERIAHGRAEKVLEQLHDAVIQEMILPVDMSKGVAGALLAHAAGLKRRAMQVSESADQIERAYCERGTRQETTP